MVFVEREERVNGIQTVGPPTLLWQDMYFKISNMADSHRIVYMQQHFSNKIRALLKSLTLLKYGKDRYNYIVAGEFAHYCILY